MIFRLLLLPLLCLASALAEEITYNTHIRPILSDKCFACHGPDVPNNKAGLRLDLAESAYADLVEGEGRAIVPGDAAASVAYQRIMSDDPNLVMPTPESHLVLSDREKDLIRQWIDEGAEYQEHWAFVDLPLEIPVPEVGDADWVEQPFDAFVLARLETETLTPAEEAAPLRWLRRATLDLTGLPPTPEAIAAFETAFSEDPKIAREQAVDALLASPAYGEHMAVGWLDAARYADSYGYQSDKLNTQWPYRDWVVRAFNDNLPYDDFVTWQLAGDLLENPTRDQRLATAFNRIHRLNNEGGAIFEEWRTENIADRVHTYGTAMLGLTMECTRCHDHKYDPITARDYFSIFAFFNSIDENGMYDRHEKVPSPTMLLPNEEQAQALENARQQVSVLEAALARAEAAAKDEFQSVEPSPASAPAPDFHLDFDGSIPEGAYFAENDHNKTAPLTFSPITGEDGNQGITLDGDRGVTITGIEPFDYWTPFTLDIRFRDSARTDSRSVLIHTTRGTDAGYNGYDLTLVGGHVESRMYRVWPGNGIGVRTVEPIPADQMQNLTATYDASGSAAGLKLYLDSKQLETEVLRDATKKMASVEVMHGGKFALGFRFRDRGLAGAIVDDLKIYFQELTQAELSDGKETIAERETHYIHRSPAVAAAREELIAARKAVIMAEEVMNEIPIMEELPEPLPAYILARGEYDAPKTEDVRVQRDTFEHILPRFDGYEKDRLGLAKWTVHPDHPLTSRVFVNRMWAKFFGAGLVDTPENFGLQGSLPSHPALLDWLSRDFVSHGWDIKRLCRNIVLSATYRQDSSASPELMERDPKNTLLARGAAYRLAAEEIRDLALASSGLMNPERGGPPVSPYQPGEDLWRESNGMSPPYKQSVGKALYRRSLYSVWKRTSPLPNMMAFDATTREVCSVARSRTNTPLQALVLLNDVQFVEAARALAQRATTHSNDEASQVGFAFLALAGRAPDAVEKDILTELYTAQIEHYTGEPGEAEKLIALGESAPDETANPAQLAALTTVCQAILSLDATIWKR